MDEKRCTDCKQLLPATAEFFSRDKQKKDGLRPQCKVCRGKERRAEYQIPEVKERILAQQKVRYSNRPDVREHISVWGKAYRARPEMKERIRTQNKAYRARPENRERLLAYHKDYYHHPERNRQIRAKNKAYRNRPEVRERSHAYKKIYYSQNRERALFLSKIRYHNPEHHEDAQAYRKAYAQHPDNQIRRKAYRKAYSKRPEKQAIRRAHHRTYQAHKKAVPGAFTAAQIQELLKKQRYRCYYDACGHAKFKRVKGKYIYHIDHTFPVSRVAGTNTPANDIGYLVLACPTCNCSKNNKFPWEWPEGGRLL